MLGLALTPTNAAFSKSTSPNYASLTTAIALAAGGAYYDPSVMSSLFQDAAAAVPVTAAGQSVRRMNDLSGNGKHMIAPSDAARPVLTSEVVDGVTYWYLLVDGVNDFMVPSSAFNLGEVWWSVSGWNPDSFGNKYLFALSNAASNKSGFKLSSNAVQCRNAADTAFATVVSGMSSPALNVAVIEQTATGSITGKTLRGSSTTLAPIDDSASTQGLALFSSGNTAWSLGMSGKFYGGVWAPGTISTPNRDIVERRVAQMCGKVI